MCVCVCVCFLMLVTFTQQTVVITGNRLGSSLSWSVFVASVSVVDLAGQRRIQGAIVHTLSIFSENF